MHQFYGMEFLGANMMIAIPNSATHEPNKSQLVGFMPSTAYSQIIAINM